MKVVWRSSLRRRTSPWLLGADEERRRLEAAKTPEEMRVDGSTAVFR